MSEEPTAPIAPTPFSIPSYTWKEVNPIKDDAECYRIVSWNILAETYIGKKNESTLFLKSHQARKLSIIQHIAYLNPDIACLQEVQNPEKWLIPAMSAIGYECVYSRRPSRNLDFSVGVATFYKSVVFTEGDMLIFDLNNIENPPSQTTPLNNSASVIVLHPLRSDGTTLVVGNLHAANKPELDDIRREQIKHVHGVIQNCVDAFKEDTTKIFPVLCGDYNMPVGSSTYLDVFANDDGALASCYSAAIGREPTATNISPGFIETIDYISTEKLHVDKIVGVLSVPELLRSDALPRADCPSDHVPIGVMFSF